MPKFRVICREKVSAEMFIEAPDKEQLVAWLWNDAGADLVSDLVERQTVREREYEVEVWNGKEAIDGCCPG